MRKLISIIILATTALGLLYLASCGRSQELVGITIQPGTETIGASNIPVPDDQWAQVQLRALGTYIHPPVTKDITNKVTWASNTPQMFTVSSTGLLQATGQSCGSTLISATLTTNSSAGGISSSGAVVTGYMTGSVVCFTGNGGIPITVGFAGPGSGSVSSNPAGLSCFSTATNCVGVFPSGSNVTLTATPNGTFVGWSGGGCGGTSLVCTITNLASPVTLTATFN